MARARSRPPDDVSTIYDYIENPAQLGEHVEPVHVPTVPFASASDAFEAYEPLTELESRWAASPYFRPLNGEWEFCWARSPADVPERLADASAWDTIGVPKPWQLAGYDRPIYRNHALTWEDIPELRDEPEPPAIPREFNPVGTYRRTLSVPEDWTGRETRLHFEGVKSAFFVWVDGAYVGYDQGSMTPTEFDLSEAVEAGGEHTLTVQVVRFSDGSLLETQDMLRFSGIFRSVYLYSKPETHLRDYAVRTTLDDAYEDARLGVDADVALADRDGVTLAARLYDPAGDVVFEREAAVEGDGDADVTADVRAPAKWSAESPTLYTLVLSLVDAAGETIEAIPQHVGFREYEIRDGCLCVNGRPLTLRGVNRHEHDPETGRTVPVERVREEFAVMKRHNVNAVRAAHYPNDPTMYALADELGLYVVDEANVETHFDLNFVNEHPEFHESFVERFRRMVDHHKNFTSIVMWSTSNEAGTGPAHEEMAEYARAVDPTRFVYHQGSGEAPYEDHHEMMTGTAPFTDVSGPRYPVPDSLAQHSVLDDRPLVMGEYAHALCNSLGHQEAYWGLIDRIDRLQGGFVWEWANQTLNADALPAGDAGADHWFDESSFLLDGLTFADLTPKPTLAQVKKTQQPFTVDSVAPSAGIATITNRHHFTDLSAYDVMWELTRDGEVVQEDVLDVQVAPGETRGLMVPVDAPEDPGRAEWYLTVRVRLPEETAWADAGHSLGFAQFPVPFDGTMAGDSAAVTDAVPAEPAVERDGDDVTVDGEAFTYRFDADRGCFTELAYAGDVVATGGPLFDAYRAATPNEGHVATEWGYDARAEWDDIGLNDLRHDVSALSVHRGRPVRLDVETAVENARGTRLFEVVYAYEIRADGTLDVDVTATPTDALTETLTTWLPRVGVDVDLPAAMTEMTWFGRGPMENYPDRKVGAEIGRHDVSFADQFVPYRIPEDNANKCDVRWAALSGEMGAGLVVTGTPAMNVRPDGFENTATASRLDELVPRDGTRLALDATVAGVGGTPHRPLEQYRPQPEETSFSLTFRPYDRATTDAAALARSVRGRD